MNPIFLLTGLFRDNNLLIRIVPVILGTLLICLVLLRRHFRNGR